MLIDLYILQTYFEEPHSVVYEEDLVRQYGNSEVINAIRSGFLEHRRIPCGSGRQHCVCWLSDKGRDKAQAMTL